MKAVVGTVAIGLLTTGCGGTRESDAAIQQAAGVGAASSAAPADAGFAGAGGDVAAGAAAPVANAPVAAAPDAASTTTTASTTTGTAPAAATTAKKPAAGTAAATTGKKPAAGTAATSGAAKTVKKTEAAAPSSGGGTPAIPGVANKSVIKLGAVGTFSGPVGGLVKDTITGIRAWSQAVNASGGVNGHPVQVLVGDDGGDPARYNSILQQFVEQQGVVAFLYTTLGFSPNGNNKYLDSKHIFTFSTEGGLEVAYNDPYVLTATPTGLTNADSLILAFGKAIKASGGVKLASFACSDFGLCDNFDKRWSDKTVLDKAGFTLVARGRPSLTQPDYTSQCLAAKQAGATAIMIAMDGAAIRRFAGDCARQNYHPKLATADLVATKDLPGDKNVDGLIIGTKMSSFADTRVEGVKEAYAAFARYAPGQTITGGMTNGWIIGEFFAQAGKNLPDKVTLSAIEDGLYSIKNNNLKGMTYPITMERGKPMARQLCYGVAVIQGDKFVPGTGQALYCEKNGKPLNNLDDYGTKADSTKATDQNAPVRAALLAPKRVDVPASLPTPATPAAPVAPDATCPPARATGWSYLLDAFQTGSAAGPGVFYGIALAALGTPLPEPLGAYQGQFLQASGSSVEKFSHDTPAAIQGLRTYFEPFAVYNDYGNAFVDLGATSMDSFAGNYGSFIQPGDTSMREFASSMRDAKATQTPCAITVKDSGDPVVNALAKALANGKVDEAKALLAKDNLKANTDKLGQAVFYAGVAAADANAYDGFIKATSQSFVDGGVSPMDTGKAFQAAASKAASEGLTMEQGAIGFRTICETYQRYLTEGKLS
jgi:ABC-type branched-subunit amino acid transport system substrate-binding protein